MSEEPDTELHGKVLCIEDHEINMIVVEELLRQYSGVTMIKAATGWEGVRLAREERPDLVLLDMHLPDIGGLEVVRALNEEIYRHRLRIALLTGDALSMDIVKAMSLGAYDYWVKPLRRDKLDVALRRALSRNPVEPAKPSPFGHW
jgi:CheY-like chemotaxis protein